VQFTESDDDIPLLAASVDADRHHQLHRNGTSHGRWCSMRGSSTRTWYAYTVIWFHV